MLWGIFSYMHYTQGRLAWSLYLFDGQALAEMFKFLSPISVQSLAVLEQKLPNMTQLQLSTQVHP
jgi:hypothetical protein